MKRIGVIGVPDNWSSENLVKEVDRKTGYRNLIDMSKVFFEMESGKVMHKETDLSTLDALIIKKIGSNYSSDYLDRLEILRYLSEKGIKVFSHPVKIMGMLDRLSCTIKLRQGEIPIPPTVVTEDIDHAFDALQNFGKAVLKPLYTSKARGMLVVEAGKTVKRDFEQYQARGNTVFYIQKFITSPGKDLGLVFLGGEYFAAYARVAHKNSWNTSTHSGGWYEPFHPSQKLIDLARKAQALFGLDFTCVDIVETPEGPNVFEVSAFGGFRGLMETTGKNPAIPYVDYVLGKLKNGK